jgi:hypothetical protein
MPEIHDLRFQRSSVESQDHPAAGSEQPVVVELDPDSNRTLKALRSCDAGDGYERFVIGVGH